MAKKEEKVINYELELPRLFKELEEKVTNTTDPTLLEEYRKQLWRLMVISSDIQSFKLLTNNTDIMGESTKREYFDDLFTSANLASFGGFDYYYLEDINKLMNGNINDNKTSIGMLINESQLRKLQQTIDCMEDVSFIGYVDENGQEKYAIWQIDSPLFISLIPFRRTENGNLQLNGVTYKAYGKEDERNMLPYKVLKRKVRA
jgi:hypothetical protein